MDAVCTDAIREIPQHRQQAANRRRSEQAKTAWEGRRDELCRLYYDEHKSLSEIGARFGVSGSGMRLVMKRMGLSLRSHANYGHRNGRFKDGSQSRLYRTVIEKDRCVRCGTSSDLGIHHKNDDHYDNRAENLEVLCNSCHMSLTKKKWWDAKKAGLPTPKSNGPVGWVRIDRELDQPRLFPTTPEVQLQAELFSEGE